MVLKYYENIHLGENDFIRDSAQDIPQGLELENTIQINLGEIEFLSVWGRMIKFVTSAQDIPQG